MKNTFYSNKFDIGKHNVPFINKKVNNKYIKGGPVSTTNDVLDANGNVVIVGSHGEYKGRVNEYVTVTKISAKLVIFKSDEDGKIRDVYIDKFSKNFYLEIGANSNTSTNIATPLPIKKETIIKDKPIKQKFSSKDIFKEQKDETIFFDGEANFENIFSNYLQKNLITFKSVQKNDEIDDIIRNYNNSIQKLS